MEEFLDVSFLTHQLNILIQEESDILPTSSQITVALGIDITREIETADTTTEGEVQHRGKKQKLSILHNIPYTPRGRRGIKVRKSMVKSRYSQV